jgi:ribonuclease HIII
LTPDELERLLRREGIEISETRGVPYGTQYRLKHGDYTATLNLYCTGKVVVQGKDSYLKSLLQELCTEGTWPVLDPTPRAGTDEAGKGDYFGPLVVAGVRVVGEGAAERLRQLGVRDSKRFSPARIRVLSGEIEQALDKEDVAVFCLSPPEYERRRTASGSVNRLLAELNVEVFHALREGIGRFVVDDFGGARTLIEPGLPDSVELEVRPRAEDDAAVAAASILARACYLEEMDVLSNEVGVELPRGAAQVKESARRLFESHGPETLAEVAKISFSITDEL